jgi:hypothetical protein
MNEVGAYCSPEGNWQGNTKPDGVEFKQMGVTALANAIPGMGALTSLDISNNDLIRGAYEGDGNYATDMTGMCPLTTRVHSSLTQRYCMQVLSPLRMPSPA